MTRLARLEKEAIAFIRNAENLALSMDERGFHVAFSGGKDSQVLLALVEMAGVKHHAEMQVTTVDSPNLMQFVRKNYPQVKLDLPKKNMYQLILDKKMLPTRKARFCCSFLKEQAGPGTVTCLGIRAAESTKRAKRSPVEVIGHRVGYEIKDDKLIPESSGGELMFETECKESVYCVGGKDKVVISPIFDWSDQDVWNFIREHNMPYCDLYDKGFHRIGCLFCPMANLKEKRLEQKMFPLVAERVYIRAIRGLMELGNYDQFESAEQVFEWWISGDSSKVWLAKQRTGQIPGLLENSTDEFLKSEKK